MQEEDGASYVLLGVHCVLFGLEIFYIFIPHFSLSLSCGLPCILFRLPALADNLLPSLFVCRCQPFTSIDLKRFDGFQRNLQERYILGKYVGKFFFYFTILCQFRANFKVKTLKKQSIEPEILI